MYLIKFFLIITILFYSSCSSKLEIIEESVSMPNVYDERLELTLFAEDPDIVTPIGIAVDSLNRIYVLESHTHIRPKDYEGPEGDVIKIFTDNNEDGKPDQINVFDEGFKEGLNISFSPEGKLFVVTSREVWSLSDKNKDGICDEKVKVIELTEPDYVYAHAALLGITFSNDGWMYISRGNTGGAAWKMMGIDGSSISGYGDGGNIARARFDGSELEEVATGFWNPMDLKFDDYGRLLVADNDPDSRGPNRLTHLTKGGNYGYKSLYGGSGIHPYLAWNGELPGTLPYAVELGEAPSGLFNTSKAALPPGYEGKMICSIWEESRIVLINLSKDGASVKGDTKILIEGDQDFRPVAFDSDNRGAIYFTDWVLRDYPNHGKGKIWKLQAKTNEIVNAKPKFEPYLPNDEKEKLENLYSSNSLEAFPKLKEALLSDDPFLINAAVEGLKHENFRKQVIELSHDPNADLRLGALLALQKAGVENPEVHLKRFLQDRDTRVRQMALIWTGSEGISSLKPHLDLVFSNGTVSGKLFETYLETQKHLMPDYIEGYAKKSGSSKEIKRELPENFIRDFISDQSKSTDLRRQAIKYIKNPKENIDLLSSLLIENKDSDLRIEVVRTLSSVPDEKVAHQLKELALNIQNSVILRSEALLALTYQPFNMTDEVQSLLNDPMEDIKIEALKYLRSKNSADKLSKILSSYDIGSKGSEAISQQVKLATLKGEQRVALNKWEASHLEDGDPKRGRRVFYSTQSLCSSCHSIDGRGGDLGPDLSNIGLSKSSDQILNAILNPSEEISPEWQGWFIKLKSGAVHQGRQIDVGSDDIVLITQNEGSVKFPKDQIEEYGMSEFSLMPKGLEKNLTKSDLKDLLAFLEAFKK